MSDLQRLPVLLACSHQQCTAHGTAAHLRRRRIQNPTTTADWHDPAPEWACACLKLVFSNVCDARPNPLHDTSGRASCGSLQSPLWQAGCPNDDIQTDAVHSPTRAAAFAERHRPVLASDTERQTYEDQPIHTPDAQIGRADPSHHARLVASHQASVVFCRKILKRGVIQHRICKHAFQLVVLVFKSTKLLGIRHVHAAKLCLVFIEGRITDAVAATQLLRLHTSLIFFDHSNDLFVRKSTFHSPSFAWTDY